VKWTNTSEFRQWKKRFQGGRGGGIGRGTKRNGDKKKPRVWTQKEKNFYKGVEGVPVEERMEALTLLPGGKKSPSCRVFNPHLSSLWGPNKRYTGRWVGKGKKEWTVKCAFAKRRKIVKKEARGNGQNETVILTKGGGGIRSM